MVVHSRDAADNRTRGTCLLCIFLVRSSRLLLSVYDTRGAHQNYCCCLYMIHEELISKLLLSACDTRGADLKTTVVCTSNTRNVYIYSSANSRVHQCQLL